MANKDLHYFNN